MQECVNHRMWLTVRSVVGMNCNLWGNIMCGIFSPNQNHLKWIQNACKCAADIAFFKPSRAACWIICRTESLSHYLHCLTIVHIKQHHWFEFSSFLKTMCKPCARVIETETDLPCFIMSLYHSSTVTVGMLGYPKPNTFFCSASRVMIMGGLDGAA